MSHDPKKVEIHQRIALGICGPLRSTMRELTHLTTGSTMKSVNVCLDGLFRHSNGRATSQGGPDEIAAARIDGATSEAATAQRKYGPDVNGTKNRQHYALWRSARWHCCRLPSSRHAHRTVRQAGRGHGDDRRCNQRT